MRIRTGRFWGKLCWCTLLCSLFVAACGAPAPAQKPLFRVLLATATSTGTIPSTNTMAASASLRPIQLVSSQSRLAAYPGGIMSMSVATSPYALCTVSVDYGRGVPSHNPGIAPTTADASGIARWTWRVEGDARVGAWPLTVTAVLPGGARTSSQVNVSVTLPAISIVSAQTVLRAAHRTPMLLTIATAPFVDCTVALHYGAEKPTKYLKTRSNAAGIATWTWRVDDSVAAGAWPVGIIVTLTSGQQAFSQVTSVVV